jgi:phospholipid/cholesterol/gamma-HCH transport system permease protein
VSKLVRISTNTGVAELAFEGAFTSEPAQGAWKRVVEVAGGSASRVVFDLGNMTECDGIGLALLTDADRIARERGAETDFVGASEEIAELLRLAKLDPAGTTPERPGPGLVESVGAATAGLAATSRSLATFIGDLTVASLRGLATINGPRLRDVLRACTRVGADAVPVVSLLGGIIGFILAVQAAKALMQVGANSLVPMVVGFATLREFGPLIAGIILAGRSGAAFAAEIGTMKVTEELDAYNTFALDPMVVLVFPRVLAGVIVSPILTLYSILLAIVGGWLPMISQGWEFNAYLQGINDAVHVGDLAQALIKGTIFGLIFAALGCFHGLRTGSGANAVGESTTRAVVAGIVAILVADGILNAIFFSFGF